jgi:hypothetical protein
MLTSAAQYCALTRALFPAQLQISYLRLLDRLVDDPLASLGVQMQADEDSWSARSSRSRIGNQTDISSIRNIVKAASDNQISSVFFSVLSLGATKILWLCLLDRRGRAASGDASHSCYTLLS